MTGYVRKDTSNNIADGNIINAADLDAEFDGVVDAFNASTGHKHDGTTGEGAPITVVGPTQDVTVSATAVTPKTTNTVDLGSSSLKFKDIFIAGTATLPTVSATTGNITTVNATTVDTTNVEVTNIKAKDGTASASIADATGVMTIASAILTTADINGGTIDGTVIGGTTAAAGAFLTLSASGAVTLSGGTANGVAYLNGSKVLTTGSALVFDGTGLGVGYATPASVLNDSNDIVVGGTSDALAGMTFLNSSTGSGTIKFADAVSGGASGRGVIEYNHSTDYLGLYALTGQLWNVGGSEQMRLTSTGLGIGTSSPAYKLQLNSGSAVDIETGVSNSAGLSRFGTRGSGNSFAGSFTAGKSLELWSAGSLNATLDSSGNLGLGVTPSAWSLSGLNALQIKNGSLYGYINEFGSQANAYYNAGWKYITSAAASQYVQTSGAHQWYTAPSGTAGNAISFTQAMTLDASGNLGIGTSSPAYKLDVLGTSRIYQSGNTAASLMLNANQGTISTGYAFTLAQSNSAGNYNFTIAEGATTYLTLTNSISGAAGNLGLGVTPSAWSTFKAFEFGTANGHSLFGSGGVGGETHLGTNVYYNAGYKYANNDFATDYKQTNGVHSWHTASSGTAGNAISFTQAMTLDASGNLGVGTTSPGYKLVASGNELLGATVGCKINSIGTTYGAGSYLNAFSTAGGNDQGFAGFIASQVQQTNRFYAGVHSPSGVNQSFIGTPDANPLAFWTNATERARIDSSGNLLVGKTADNNSAGVTLYPSGNAYIVRDGNTALALNRLTSDGTIASFSRSTVAVGSISVTTTATAYNTSSDYRLKENIAPMTGALAKVAALKPCTYKWKADGSDGEGFIAHELAEVVPQCVTGEKDAVDEGGKPVYQGIDTSFLVATLTAAIQEQQAIINAQQTALEQLKAQLTSVSADVAALKAAA